MSYSLLFLFYAEKNHQLGAYRQQLFLWIACFTYQRFFKEILRERKYTSLEFSIYITTRIALFLYGGFSYLYKK